MQIILGFDAGWGGLGWCLASDHGPLATGWKAFPSGPRRWPGLARYLAQDLAHQVADARLLRLPSDPPIRMVIETPPRVYQGTEREGPASVRKGGDDQAGNQLLVGYGMGELAGALRLWWELQPEAGEVAKVPPQTWRSWAGVTGQGREGKKRAAIAQVELRGWRRFTDPFSSGGKASGARGDVAEALLLAVASTRRLDLFLPKPPKPKKPKAAARPARGRTPTRSSR